MIKSARALVAVDELLCRKGVKTCFKLSNPLEKQKNAHSAKSHMQVF